MQGDPTADTLSATRQLFFIVWDRLERLCEAWDVLSDEVPDDVREDFDDLCRLFCALHPQHGNLSLLHL